MAGSVPNESLPRTLAGFRNFHRGETIIVCGCGASLRDFDHRPELLTIGVNDVGRLFDPAYLVVLNPRRQFQGDRFQYVEHSRARVIFTQLDLGLRHPHIVRFRLGKRGGTDLTNPNVLHYTRNSPYVALQLAMHMGAARIGIIGVDFTDDHFFGGTGRHPLADQFAQIDNEYSRLAEACARMGIEVFNLSARSRLTAFPKLHALQAEACATPQAEACATAVKRKWRATMRIAVERHPPGIVGDFLDTLAATAAKLGHSVTRNVTAHGSQHNVVSIVWNGRHHRSRGTTLYCEHAWLPRWEYQISPRGINADSHLAPFEWDGRRLDEKELVELERRLDSIRHGGPASFKYMQTAEPPATGLPEAFLLVPLQMEWDTNIQRHVPAEFRQMQQFADYVSRANPPLPIIFKQHPADIRRGNRQLRLRLRRKQDAIRSHTSANIHQLLKGGKCRGIISLNSNVVHDALIWNVPAVVLGKGVWSRSGRGPFLTSLPRDWAELEMQLVEPEAVACRQAYAFYLMKNQWKLEDAGDERKVADLLAGLPAAGAAPGVVASLGRRSSVVNVAALNRGWFFEDLKQHFRTFSTRDLNVVVSERPVKDADAWVFIRTREAAGSPDLSRTLVQIHDMFDQGLYRPGGERSCVSRCSAVALTHPGQREILEKSGIHLEGKPVMCRPLGALESFQLRTHMPARFTIGWVGRPVKHFGHDLKRVEWIVECARRLGGSARVVLLGERLEEPARTLRRAGIDCEYQHRLRNPIAKYPEHYKKLDCILISSMSEAGPLCLFEALATGVPVVSTRVGWAPLLLRHGENGYLVDSVGEMSAAVAEIRENRKEWFDRREAIRRSLNSYTLESWVSECLRLAAGLASVEAGAATHAAFS